MNARASVVLALAMLGALVVGWQAKEPAAPAAPPARDGVFVHLSADPADAHAVLMALKMASVMADDRDVLVYVDLKGVEVFLKDAADVTHPAFDSSRAQTKALLDKGVPVYICPSCLKAAAKAPEDLMPGVKLADKNAFFTFTKGRILTLDY